MANLISRNNVTKYSYFFVTKTNSRTLAAIKFPVFEIFRFENPVTAERGKSQLKDDYTTSILEITDENYTKGYFIHPFYRNQKNELLQIKYSDLPVKTVKVSDSKSVGLPKTNPASDDILIKRSINELSGQI